MLNALIVTTALGNPRIHEAIIVSEAQYPDGPRKPSNWVQLSDRATDSTNANRHFPGTPEQWREQVAEANWTQVTGIKLSSVRGVLTWFSADLPGIRRLSIPLANFGGKLYLVWDQELGMLTCYAPGKGGEEQVSISTLILHKPDPSVREHVWAVEPGMPHCLGFGTCRLLLQDNHDMCTFFDGNLRRSVTRQEAQQFGFTHAQITDTPL